MLHHLFDMKKIIFYLIYFLTVNNIVFCQTISEKKAKSLKGFEDLKPELQTSLNEVNQELKKLHEELKGLYNSVIDLYVQEACDDEYKDLLDRINIIKERIVQIEEGWRALVVEEDKEGYALWQQSGSTIEELIVEYGSQDYVF